ncbi:bifunctional glutamate--cysteine ligase GshA/glutathione synthetase GshB [Clostridium sp. SHJSY1]|uniref:bifunctional glutamate--cysteine ligase GshA/glutathione synthetase GshB n=1 Tax=Clostridium sp. SHJSY1 TaxID=2942483 RepID=UPI00287646DF|nr:bifunctional glutamate--cysteine ligase GshA/glutathione synthetase GshB [Clostridium sp. SHJSY1]MDS0524516.1 bifunctional glutamate--cysteine ligase GshA/glutathione synthetase GshB [Clostridium sp. SHJSY1]
MLNKIKKIFTPNELLKGNYGIERETLRVDDDGNLSRTPHPEVFGNKVTNPYITTDFSESQIEMITPPLETIEETYSYLNSLYDIVAMEIGDEYLWPQSMPSVVPKDKDIPIAIYDDSPEGTEARSYREKLIEKYGGRKQLISGIHFNFSFNEEIIIGLYNESDRKEDYKEFRNGIYLKVARNYLRYRWLIIYLLGATSTVHKTYFNDCKKCLEEISECSFSSDGALSYRNGECGYKNEIDLFPSYKTIKEYSNSLNKFIEDKVIESSKELYSQVRLKPKNKSDLISSLLKDGIDYLEYRSIDVNPFEKCGISLNDLYFLQIFNIYMLIKEESSYEKWQEEALKNQHAIAKEGLNNVILIKDGESIYKKEWALEILNEVMKINNELNLGKVEILNEMISKINNEKLTYAYRIYNEVKEKGYISAHLNLAKEYKKDSYNNRYKFEGYEDLELSTQILIKEAIKRGVKVEFLDRSDNFISLKLKDRVEYVKQATKTSKDNYATVLMMENKTVTKKILYGNDIRVPKGEEYNSLEEAKTRMKKYINQPIVIKPKSTNFGIGISIFKNGGTIEELLEAFKIAFKHDKTVLIEEFIEGKEYRFLVIDDRVVGILHRVPANVIGDGKNSIKKLVDIKNQDPLRGYGYVTPLEKIKLDENAALFLNNQNKDFDYVPSKDEVVCLRENSNISTGGDSIDYTDLIPERFKKIAVECAKAVKARVCGVDIMLEDYSKEDSKYGIIELNFNPAIHIHCFPYKGKERKIATHVLKMLEMI